MSEPITRHLSRALLEPELSLESLTGLFGSPAVVKLVMRSLPAEAQCLLVRMMLIPDASRWEPLLMWFSGQSVAERTAALKAALSVCRKWRTIKVVSVSAPGSSLVSGGRKAAAAAAGSQVSGTGKSGGGGVANIRYDVHPQFRATFLRLTTDRRVLQLPSFHWLRLPSSEEQRSLSGPNASSIESYSRQKWGSMLLWAFKQTASQSPVLRFFPITPVSAPSELLLRVLNKLGLVNSSGSSFGSDGSDVRWFLSDLSTQLDELLQTSMALCDEYAAAEAVPPRVALTVLLAQIATARICEPLLIEADAPPYVLDFTTLLHDMGVVYFANVLLLAHTYKAVYPCPLARLLSLDPNRNNPEMWTLSQMYGAESFHQTASSLSAAATLSLSLPRARYGPLAFAGVTNNIQDPPPDKVMEFAWTTPSDPLRDWLGGGGGAAAAVSEKRKGIIVESNFRVFCYHPDALQACVIASVCDVRMITPILIVAMLTRESVTRRLLEGLRAEQIIKFLSSHAHPLVIAKLLSTERTRHDTAQFTSETLQTTALPENVLNQILLWEDQLSAISQTRAALFEITDAAELAIFPHMCYRAEASGNLICHTPMPAANELQKWLEDAATKLKIVGNTSFQTKFGADKNWYPSAPIVIVKAEYKDEFLRVIKLLKTAKR